MRGRVSLEQWSGEGWGHRIPGMDGMRSEFEEYKADCWGGGYSVGRSKDAQLLLSILSPPPRIERPQLLSTETHPPSQRTKGTFTEMKKPRGKS